MVEEIQNNFIRNSDSNVRVLSLPMSIVKVLLPLFGLRVKEAIGSQNRVIVRGDQFKLSVDKSFLKGAVFAAFSGDAELVVGEGYMHRKWDVEEGQLEDALAAFWSIANRLPLAATFRWVGNYARFSKKQVNSTDSSQLNIKSHYDDDNVQNNLFSSMLGRSMCYSAAIFDSEHQKLDSAQINKLSRIVTLLDLRSGMNVLDIGSGWGALAESIANSGCNVTGITLSEEQLHWCAGKNAKSSSGQISYYLQDYRDFYSNNTLKLDRITCIEVLDHIGTKQYDNFFKLAYDALSEDGLFFLQLIARPERGHTSSWIDKYIYPGGYIASLEEAREAYLKAGFVERKVIPIDGEHYVRTLNLWRDSFKRGWDELSAKNGLDEVFYRKWEFFLSYSIVAFQHAGFCNYHVVLEKENYTGERNDRSRQSKRL